MTNSDEMDRRRFVVASLFAVLVPLGACSREGPSNQATSSSGPALQAEPVAMTVYRDPSCPCCEAWAKLAMASGFAVQVIEDADMPSRKKALGVPEALASCHTAQVAGLVFEGHVPLDHVQRLIASNHNKLAGLAVPGMPRGSPGMEMPDGSKDAFDVLGFDKNGNTSVYAA